MLIYNIMSLEKVIKKYKQARNIKDDYKLNEDEIYFVNEILELEKPLIGGVVDTACLCEENAKGKGISGWCSKHHTDWM
jgi:hypothetical protein